MNAPISTRSCPTHNVVCPSCVSTLALETLGVMQLWQRMLFLLVGTDASCAIVCPVCVLCFATGGRRGVQSAMKVVICFLQCVSQFPEETSVAAPPHSALLVRY